MNVSTCMLGKLGHRPGLASKSGLNFIITNDQTAHIQRWSQKFGPVFKVDRMMKVTIQNEEKKEPFA